MRFLVDAQAASDKSKQLVSTVLRKKTKATNNSPARWGVSVTEWEWARESVRSHESRRKRTLSTHGSLEALAKLIKQEKEIINTRITKRLNRPELKML